MDSVCFAECCGEAPVKRDSAVGFHPALQPFAMLAMCSERLIAADAPGLFEPKNIAQSGMVPYGKIGFSVHFLSFTNYRSHLRLMKLRCGAEYS